MVLKEITEKALDALVNQIKEKMPDRGTFPPTGIKYVIPETENMAVFIVESVATDPDQRIFKVVVLRQGTDREYTHFLHSGNSIAIREYLEKDTITDEILKSVKELSERVEDYYQY